MGITRLTQTHGEFKAQHRQCGPGARTFVAHGTSTRTTMVLSEAKLFLVHHGAQVPEERPLAQLTLVGFYPGGCLGGESVKCEKVSW